MPQVASPAAGDSTLLGALNGRYHKSMLMVYMVVVLAHWLEHIAQALQVYALGYMRPAALGLAGARFPVLVSSEALHFGYAVFMLGGLLLLRRGLSGRARTWWDVALAIQAWHFFEHLLLFVQASVGVYLLGQPQPISVLQFAIPRLELHLLYNLAVMLPILVAWSLHWYPRDELDSDPLRCGCVHRLA